MLRRRLPPSFVIFDPDIEPEIPPPMLEGPPSEA
jgi:hypothetical protein